MKLRDILRNIEVLELKAGLDMEISDVTYDSRSAGPGTAFVVLEGYTAQGKLFNSNVRYIESAVNAGASVIISREAPAANAPYVLVKDSQKALALASGNLFGWPSDKLKVVGVTGTNGKTTTTTLIWDIIGRLTGKKAGLIGTNRNVVGDTEYEAEHTTPEARELHELFSKMVQTGCEYAVMEVSSHSLAFDRVEGVSFEVGCFTNLSQDHLDYHITMENYLEAKARLFDISRYAVINADEEAAGALIKRTKGRVYTYAADNKASLKAENIVLKPDRVEFDAVYGQETAPVVLNIPGRYNVYNALAAISCCLCLGFKLIDITEALKACSSVKGRLEVVPTGRDFTILIDYAVTPDALDSMIRTVRQTARGRVGVLFGCGGDRDRTKRPKMGRVVASLADYVIITSDNPRTEEPEAIIRDILEGLTDITTPYVVIPDRREAIRWAIENAQSGDTIVLAGKGHETYQIVGKTKYHMDEREIIAEVLKG
jgi:UDP-N-acetylmuramoyl-L-alanyl-D-glutamate--2,6-diaminopimelate ligase